MNIECRARRSQLITPASKYELIAKAAASDCDSLVIDLEDALAVSQKLTGREIMRRAVSELDFGSKEVCVRVNGLQTPWAIDDILAIQGLPVDAVVVPKVHCAKDMHAWDAIVGHLTMRGHTRGIAIQALIESGQGLEHVYAIAKASKRCSAIIFGVGDFIADTGVAAQAQSLWYARSRIAAAAAAAGIQAIDHVNPYVGDLDALTKEATDAKGLGYAGKWAIHPAQLGVINQAFSPLEHEIAMAKSVVSAYENAAANGIGSFSLNGVMIDEATIKIAKRHLAASARMAAK